MRAYPSSRFFMPHPLGLEVSAAINALIRLFCQRETLFRGSLQFDGSSTYVSDTESQNSSSRVWHRSSVIWYVGVWVCASVMNLYLCLYLCVYSDFLGLKVADSGLFEIFDWCVNVPKVFVFKSLESLWEIRGNFVGNTSKVYKKYLENLWEISEWVKTRESLKNTKSVRNFKDLWIFVCLKTLKILQI